jgi:YbbR domain-containing protein
MKWLKSIQHNLQSLFLAFLMAIFVWISAVSNADPTQEQAMPSPVPIEIIGQNSELIITNDIATQVNVTLSAPQSIWNSLTTEKNLVRAIVDLSDLANGDHRVPVQLQIGIRPVKVVEYSPQNMEINLERLATKELTIDLLKKGSPAVGYLAGDAELEENTVIVSGAESQVNKVVGVQTSVNLSQVKDEINQVFDLVAVDESGTEVSDVLLEPEGVRVTIPIEQRGGYRNVVVKVVTSGSISTGYRVTNISVYPPAVTVFSADPQLVEDLPGYVDTLPIDLSGAKDDMDLQLQLDLPPGITVVGDQKVEVQVGIATIEGSLTLSNQVVEIDGLSEGLEALVAPDNVDVILSGPLPILDALRSADIRVYIDVSDLIAGTYQRIPQIELNISDLTVESILPGSVEVTLSEVLVK